MSEPRRELNNNNNTTNPPVELLVDELYKCAHPPPSYSTATGISTFRRTSERQRELTFIAPFGGSLCRIFPFSSNNTSRISSTTTPPPPSIYTESPPVYTGNSTEDDRNRCQFPRCTAGFQFSRFCSTNNNINSTNKKQLFSGVICLIFILITICLFVILDRLLLD